MEKEIERIIKEGKESFVSSILLISLAVILFLNPDNFVKIAINVFGYLGIFFGVIEIFIYLRLPEEAKIFTKNLMNGIILILYGILAIIEADLMKNFFTILLGGYLIFKNASRFQIAANLYEKKKKLAAWLFLFSSINLILSFLLIINPMSSSVSLNLYLSVLILIIEGIYMLESFLILICLKKKKEEIEG